LAFERFNLSPITASNRSNPDQPRASGGPGPDGWAADGLPPGGQARELFLQVGHPSAPALALLIGAAGASPAAAELHVAIQLEAIHMEIDFYRLDAFEEILVDDILVAVHVKIPIRFVRLIQSHGQAGTASAAFVQKNSNGANLLALEICRNLFSGRRCYFEHGVLLKKIQLLLTSASGAAGKRMAVMTLLLWAARFTIESSN
jgi:hypothetical protein